MRNKTKVSDDKKVFTNSYKKSINKPERPVESGNIDLNNRPVLKNSDGSISTVRSMSFNDGKHEVLVPTIGSKNGKPYQMTDDEAIDNYRKTGQHLGKFKSINGATKYAKWLHKMQERQYK